MISIRFSIAAAVATVLVAGPVFASDPARKPAEISQASAKQRVCVVQPATTGTILAKKVCKTRAQWIAQTGVDPIQGK